MIFFIFNFFKIFLIKFQQKAERIILSKTKCFTLKITDSFPYISELANGVISFND